MYENELFNSIACGRMTKKMIFVSSIGCKKCVLERIIIVPDKYQICVIFSRAPAPILYCDCRKKLLRMTLT